MGKTLLAALTVVLVVASAGSWGASAFDECSKLASEKNKLLPMNIDQATVLVTIGCKHRGNKVVWKQTYTVNLPDKEFAKKILAGQKTLVRNFTCSNPEMKAGFKVFDYEFSYLDTSGNLLSAISVTRSDCD